MGFLPACCRPPPRAPRPLYILRDYFSRPGRPVRFSNGSQAPPSRRAGIRLQNFRVVGLAGGHCNVSTSTRRFVFVEGFNPVSSRPGQIRALSCLSARARGISAWPGPPCATRRNAETKTASEPAPGRIHRRPGDISGTAIQGSRKQKAEGKKQKAEGKKASGTGPSANLRG